MTSGRPRPPGAAEVVAGILAGYDLAPAVAEAIADWARQLAAVLPEPTPAQRDRLRVLLADPP